MAIREEIERKLEDGGSLSSDDVAGFGASENSSAATEQALKESTRVEREKTRDKLIGAGGESSDRFIPQGAVEIDITPDDKEAFTAALIGNTRMTLSMTRLGGKCTVVIRSRTVRETDAIIKQLQRESRAGKFNAQMDQTIRLRTLVMAFQVAELDGVEYASPEEPLIETVTDAGTTPPAWVARADAWYDRGDAMNAIIWNCVQEFEDKYWMMTENAANADFWQPVAST